MIPARMLAMGRPAKAVREATAAELRLGIDGAGVYLGLLEVDKRATAHDRVGMLVRMRGRSRGDNHGKQTQETTSRHSFAGSRLRRSRLALRSSVAHYGQQRSGRFRRP